MKVKAVSDLELKFILENKDTMFKNQIAVALNLSQATVRRIILKNETQP
jgi:predicted transcriptional regulator